MLALNLSLTTEGAVSPEIVVEAPAFPPEEDAQPVPVTSGTGALPLDPQYHELGVSLWDAEGKGRLYGERKDLFKQGLSQQNHRLLSEAGTTPKLAGRTRGRWGPLWGDFQAGVLKSQQQFVYLDNAHTPYDPSDDRPVDVSPSGEGYFATLKLKSGPWKWQGDADYLTHKSHAGSRILGQRTRYEQNLGISYKSGRGEATAFLFLDKSDFKSLLPQLTDSSQRGLRSGVQWNTRLAGWGKWRGELSLEEHERTLPEGVGMRFQRYSARADVKSETKRLFFLETEVTGMGLLAQDQSASFTRAHALWEAGIGLSTTRQAKWGMELLARRYARLPTGSQLFGDGALLLPSLFLPMETGVRAAFGPWAGNNQRNTKIHVFLENGEGQALPIAVSPVAVRMEALGAVEAFGVLLEQQSQWGDISTRATYCWQKATNLSSVNWQRGKSVPGRPEHGATSDVSYGRNQWKLGMGYILRAGEALDLGGFWMRPPSHQLTLMASYEEKNWLTRVQASSPLGNPGTQTFFEGQAGPNLLEPELLGPRFSVVIEVSL